MLAEGQFVGVVPKIVSQLGTGSSVCWRSAAVEVSFYPVETGIGYHTVGEGEIPKTEVVVGVEIGIDMV